jgi:hypothetical protein
MKIISPEEGANERRIRLRHDQLDTKNRQLIGALSLFDASSLSNTIQQRLSKYVVNIASLPMLAQRVALDELIQSCQGWSFVMKECLSELLEDALDSRREGGSQTVVIPIRVPHEIPAEAAAIEFPRFQKLPPELRIMVWGFAREFAEEPRVHCTLETRSFNLSQMDPLTRRLGLEVRRSHNGINELVSNQPLHPLLRVCFESRELYLQVGSFLL